MIWNWASSPAAAAAPRGVCFCRGEQRGKHLYIVGSTGSGKSKLAESLIRQDILQWPRSRCGLIVFDPHGALFDGLMTWVAAKGLSRLPIVPIDLRRSDWIVSYNPLRPQAVGDPAVVVGGLAQAIVHAWGQGDMDQTPRLAKYLPAVLGTLYEQGHTLLDALHLLGSEELRRAMTARVQSFVSRTVWDMTAGLRPAEFQEEIGSTLNRLLRFLSSRVMRATLCQTGASLDLGRALEEGSIILVALATAGSQVDATDAHTLGSVLLSDLWTAAQARGKRDEGRGGVKPFYCYIDEFQSYVTPVMAEALDQARGFGLHLTLSHQFPSQLSGRGELGQLIFDSVMANTRSKVVFQLDHPEDLPLLALWLGRQQINLDEVKHQHYTTKVMGHDLQYLPSYSEADSDAESEGYSTGTTRTDGTGGSSTYTRSTGSTHSASSGEGSSSGESWAESDDDEGREGKMRTVSEGGSESSGESWAESASESWAQAASWSESTAHSTGTSTSRSRGHTSGVSHAPMLLPVMGREASPPQFRTIEEQLFRFSQWLGGQADRHAIVRLAGTKLPVPMRVPTVVPGLTTARFVEWSTLERLARLPFALPMDLALRRLDARLANFADNLLNALPVGEPLTYARPVEAKLLPPGETVPPAPTPKRRSKAAPKRKP